MKPVGTLAKIIPSFESISKFCLYNIDFVRKYCCFLSASLFLLILGIPFRSERYILYIVRSSARSHTGRKIFVPHVREQYFMARRNNSTTDITRYGRECNNALFSSFIYDQNYHKLRCGLVEMEVDFRIRLSYLW